MSKLNSVASFVTIIGVVIAGATYYKTFHVSDNNSPKGNVSAQDVNKSIKTPREITTEAVVDISSLENDCDAKYSIVRDTINKQSLSYERDASYLKAVKSATNDQCFEYAYSFSELLTLGYERDASHQVIYKSAIQAGAFDAARKSIDKLTLGYERDEGYKALTEAMVN